MIFRVAIPMFAFGMQIVDGEGAKSDQLSMSVVAKPTNTIAPIVYCIQLFEDTMTNSFMQSCLTRAAFCNVSLISH